MKKDLLLSALFCTLFAICGNAQDIHFSQFYENAILRNPALTGIFSGDYKAGVNYRSQWSDISSPYQTAIASAESRILLNREVRDYLSYGITATYDKAGSISFNSYQIYGAINYNKSLEDVHHSYLSLGFAGGYMQRSVDMSKMTFSSQYINGSYSEFNPTGETTPFRSISNYDLATGISLNSSIGEYNNINYYIGAAAYHITQPVQSFDNQYNVIHMSVKWNGNFGFKVNIDPQYSFTVHVNYSSENPYQELIGGGLVNWKNQNADETYFSIGIGTFYRLNDAIIPTFKIEYRNYSLTTSYDINSSALKPATNGAGGFEMSLYVRGNYKNEKKLTYIRLAPRFEDFPTGFDEE